MKNLLKSDPSSPTHGDKHDSVLGNIGVKGQKISDPLAWILGDKYTNFTSHVLPTAVNSGLSTVMKPFERVDKTINPIRRIPVVDNVMNGVAQKPGDALGIAAGTVFGGGAALGGLGGAGGGAAGAGAAGGVAGAGGWGAGGAAATDLSGLGLGGSLGGLGGAGGGAAGAGAAGGVAGAGGWGSASGLGLGGSLGDLGTGLTASGGGSAAATSAGSGGLFSNLSKSQKLQLAQQAMKSFQPQQQQQQPVQYAYSNQPSYVQGPGWVNPN